MKRTDLQFHYPEELVATEPARPTRVMWTGDANSQSVADAREVTVQDLLKRIPSGDVLIVNDTLVLRRRVFAGELEILFLTSDAEGRRWQVLFPSRTLKIGDVIELPLGRQMTLLKKGRPQEVETDQPLSEKYFNQAGELPLPPYIQKAREERHNRDSDESWYQTGWAAKPGSFAAPTASLHFQNEDLKALEDRGVKIARVTLHVGLGTFLPVTADDLNEHQMHAEWAEVPPATWQLIQEAKAQGHHIWAMGTTVTRTLESAAGGRLQPDGRGGFLGATDLLIQPGYKWKVVDRLLTNFHQPESTLLALVAAFSSLERVKACYQWAIERKFRLFSYGDLSVWIR